MTLPAMMRHGDLAAVAARADRVRRLESAKPVRRIRLWLPVTPLFWLLSPFALLLAPLLTLAPPLRGMNPFAAIAAIGHVLVSVGGTEILIDARDAQIRIRIL